jgi:YidC/Oxa1 family membrane protein insertase
LAAPDTIAHFGAFSLNLLPILMTATMMLQMRLTPTPTADNTQKTMMQFMPLIFLAGFYAMPSGMILYWTCNNVFTIFQQYLTNRRKDAPVEQAKPLDLPKAKRR